MGLKLGTKNIVVLSSWKHVKELFEKRGNIYSSRPPHYIGDHIVFPRQVHLVFVPYGPMFRTLRRALNAILHINVISSFIPIQEAESIQTLHDLVHTPEKYYDHMRRYASVVILESIFGQRAEFNSPKVKELNEVHHRMAKLEDPASAPPVDILPILKYLPGWACWWKKEASWVRETEFRIYSQLYNETKERVEQGRGNGCAMERIIVDQEKFGLDEEHMKYLGGMLMEAGADTTSSVLLSFLLAMVTHPHVLRKAQQEVDTICGLERLPTFEDAERLPYMNACITEVQRWRPAVPGGSPHMLTEDDIYDGLFLPKGTTVFANAYALQHDEDEYEAPTKFIPERWLQSRYGSFKPSINDEGRRILYSFGAGRRICPGQRLAENSLIITLAKLVWGFDISKAAGMEADDSFEKAYCPGFVTAPEKFPCEIRPRDKERVKVIESELEKAKLVLERYEVL